MKQLNRISPAVCDADGRGERTVAFAPAGILRGNILPSPMAGCSYATAPIERSLTINVRRLPLLQRRSNHVAQRGSGMLEWPQARPGLLLGGCGVI
jgi:hypothetical protein